MSAGRWKPRFLPLTAARRKRVCLEDLTSREGKITLVTKSPLEETVSISKLLSCWNSSERHLIAFSRSVMLPEQGSMNSVAWAVIIRGLKLTLTSKPHACLQRWALSSFVVSPLQLVHVLKWLDFSVQETPQMLREENKKIYCTTSCLT